MNKGGFKSLEQRLRDGMMGLRIQRHSIGRGRKRCHMLSAAYLYLPLGAGLWCACCTSV